jgi:CO/xanthine dehydrogenase Mo-binding subunit
MDARAFGKSIRRKEDPRLLTGRGKYAADFRLPGMAHAAVLRSPHPHARLGSIRAKAALGLTGVLAVVTAEDLGSIGKIPVRLGPRPSVLACLQPLPLSPDRLLALIRQSEGALAAPPKASPGPALERPQLGHVPPGRTS